MPTNKTENFALNVMPGPGRLSPAQIAALLRPILPSRVYHANGQSHVPAFDVAAHLTRILGFGGWETEILSLVQISEDSEQRTRTKDGATTAYNVWTVVYACTLKLTIKDEQGRVISQWENGAAGDAINQPSRGDAHHLALTTAISTALKRCAAFGLGDQFGLSLYNKGMTTALVGRTLVGDVVDLKGEDLQNGVPLPEALGNDEQQPPVENDPSETRGDNDISRSIDSPTQGLIDPFDDPLAVLIEALKKSGMDGAEQRQFVENSIGHELPKFSEIRPTEVDAVLLDLAAYIAGSEGLTRDEA